MMRAMYCINMCMIIHEMSLTNVKQFLSKNRRDTKLIHYRGSGHHQFKERGSRKVDLVNSIDNDGWNRTMNN